MTALNSFLVVVILMALVALFASSDCGGVEEFDSRSFKYPPKYPPKKGKGGEMEVGRGTNEMDNFTELRKLTGLSERYGQHSRVSKSRDPVDRTTSLCDGGLPQGASIGEVYDSLTAGIKLKRW